MAITEVVTRETRPRCEAEIGKVGHWHLCGRPAVVFSDRTISGGAYRLYYCTRHATRAAHTQTPRSVTITQVGRIEVQK